jgi:hypothetical protein
MLVVLVTSLRVVFPRLGAAAFGFYAFAAAAQGLPTIKIEATCRASTKAVFEAIGDSSVATFESCMEHENAARAQLLKKWNTFPPADRSLCVNPNLYMPSYAEWLTCLEMRQDVRNIPKR